MRQTTCKCHKLMSLSYVILLSVSCVIVMSSYVSYVMAVLWGGSGVGKGRGRQLWPTDGHRTHDTPCYTESHVVSGHCLVITIRHMPLSYVIVIHRCHVRWWQRWSLKSVRRAFGRRWAGKASSTTATSSTKKSPFSSRSWRALTTFPADSFQNLPKSRWRWRRCRC